MGTEVQENDGLDEIVRQSVEIYIDHNNGITIRELARKYNISERTVNNRLKRAREEFYKELKSIGQKIQADLFQKYSWAEEELRAAWALNRDPAYMTQLRGIWGDIRKLLSLDDPIKAPVNEEGKALPETYLFVFNDINYKIKEEEYKNSQQQKVIEGQIIKEQSTIDQIDTP